MLYSMGLLSCSQCGRLLSHKHAQHRSDDALRVFELLINAKKEVSPLPRPYCPTCIVKLGLECYAASTALREASADLAQK